jgi:hypothetical protein
METQTPLEPKEHLTTLSKYVKFEQASEKSYALRGQVLSNPDIKKSLQQMSKNIKGQLRYNKKLKGGSGYLVPVGTENKELVTKWISDNEELFSKIDKEPKNEPVVEELANEHRDRDEHRDREQDHNKKHDEPEQVRESEPERDDEKPEEKVKKPKVNDKRVHGSKKSRSYQKRDESSSESESESEIDEELMKRLQKAYSRKSKYDEEDESEKDKRKSYRDESSSEDDSSEDDSSEDERIQKTIRRKKDRVSSTRTKNDEIYSEDEDVVTLSRRIRYIMNELATIKSALKKQSIQ